VLKSEDGKELRALNFKEKDVRYIIIIWSIIYVVCIGWPLILDIYHLSLLVFVPVQQKTLHCLGIETKRSLINTLFLTIETNRSVIDILFLTLIC